MLLAGAKTLGADLLDVISESIGMMLVPRGVRCRLASDIIDRVGD